MVECATEAAFKCGSTAVDYAGERFEGKTETERVEVSTSWQDGMDRQVMQLLRGRIAAPHRGRIALREGARADSRATLCEAARRMAIFRGEHTVPLA